jgi:hypothetical protein
MTPRTKVLTGAAVAAALTTGVVLLTLPEPPPSWPTLTLAWDPSPDPVAGYRVYSAPVPLLSEMQPLADTTNTFWPVVCSNNAAFYQVRAIGTNGLLSEWAVKTK